MSPSPTSIKLESPTLNDEQSIHDHCAICLQSLVDRTVIPTCSHEFCFECISLWAEQSQKCPLCSQLIGEYLIHHIRSQFDYQKHYLPPPRSKSPQFLQTGDSRARFARRARRDRHWGRRDRHNADEVDQLERTIAKRRCVYQNHLYAKHVASNSFTRYRPYPSPAQFAASPDMISRATIFLRRELRVWSSLDVEFLTTFTISLMKSIDIRAESAVKLLAEFLDLDAPYVEGMRHPNAEHFAHEIYCYIRSGRDLSTYDNLVQYDTSPDFNPPSEHERGNRWRYDSRSRARSPHHRRFRSRSRSRSPKSQSSDDFSSNHGLRRRTCSEDSENRHQYHDGDVAGVSIDQSQSHHDDAYEYLKSKGKQPERNRTPVLRGEHHLSSAPPCTSDQFVPNGVLESQHSAESHSGNSKRDTPPAESVPEHSAFPHASQAASHVQKNANSSISKDGDPEASSSRDRVRVYRPPRNRTLLESVQAHLSQNTTSRSTKRHAEAKEIEAAPRYSPHLSRRCRDARDHHNDDDDDDDNYADADDGPFDFSRLSGLSTNALPASRSTRSDASMTAFGENINISAGGNQSWGKGRVRSSSADPIAENTDEEMVFVGGGENAVVFPYSIIPSDRKHEGKETEKESLEGHANAAADVDSLPGRALNTAPGLSSHNNHFNINIPWEVAERVRGNEGTMTYTDTNKVASLSSASARSFSDTRVRLMQRLEEEQRVAQSQKQSNGPRLTPTMTSTSASTMLGPADNDDDDDDDDDDNNNNNNNDDDIDVDIDIALPPSVSERTRALVPVPVSFYVPVPVPGDEEASVLETRLRARALLRVRLNATKSKLKASSPQSVES